MAQQTKVITKKRKFIGVDIPLINSKVELIGENPENLKGKRINLDLTRQLRGKSVEVTLKVDVENNKPFAEPIKINLMSYFIRRMIRKRITYVEDSIITPTQQSLVQIKPFIITRKPVSNAVRRTLRNLTKNWLEDYLAERKDKEIFNDILSNRLQKPLSLKLKKTYPLSLCEIRVFEVLRELKPEEVPKIKPKLKKEKIESLDQLEEIQEEIKEQEIKEAEKEIKEAQERAISREDTSKKPLGVLDKGKETAEAFVKEIEALKNLGSLGTEEKIESEKKGRKTKRD